MAPKLDFHQIVYRDEQKSACYPFAQIHFNQALTPFFENSVIRALVLGSEADKIAVCSWKLKEKMRWNVCRPRPLSEEVLQTDYDVMSFTCNTPKHQMLAAANKWHPGFLVALGKILAEIGKKMPSEVKNPIYQNHFSARRDIYRDYVMDWLTPAMFVMQTDPEINAMVMQDSNYSKLAKTNDEIRQRLLQSIGVPYYPLIPFLLERLFPIYCHNNKIKVTYL